VIEYHALLCFVAQLKLGITKIQSQSNIYDSVDVGDYSNTVIFTSQAQCSCHGATLLSIELVP